MKAIKIAVLGVLGLASLIALFCGVGYGYCWLWPGGTCDADNGAMVFVIYVAGALTTIAGLAVYGIGTFLSRLLDDGFKTKTKWGL